MDKNLEISKKIHIFAQKDNVMGNIRTTAQLQELFKRSRERKQQEKEEQKKQRQLQYKELCKQADELLRKADEEAKKAKMEELQALAQQTPQKAQKCPHMPQGTPFYNSSLIEDNLFDYVTVYSRDEIQKMEETEGGRINWDKWDEVVNSTRQSIRDMGINLPEYKEATPRKDRRCTTTYVYDLQETLLGVFETARKAEDTFGIRRNTIAYYKFMHKPYKGYLFTDTPK
jgi:hypothetical protein